MSIHFNVVKVMTCLTVIALTGALAHPAQAQQTTQQANCIQQNAKDCMQNGSGVDPSSNLQGGGPYDHNYFAPGDGQHTPTNPLKDNKPNSGN